MEHYKGMDKKYTGMDHENGFRFTHKYDEIQILLEFILK